jgi:hypothetical protein
MSSYLILTEVLTYSLVFTTATATATDANPDTSVFLCSNVNYMTLMIQCAYTKR